MYVIITEIDGIKTYAFFTISNFQTWYEHQHDNA